MATNGTSNTVTPQSGTKDAYIPLIDFTPFSTPLSATTPTARASCAAQILHAFTHSGFLYLQNHPIPPALLTRTFAHSAAFFALPQHEKDALAWTTAKANRGYTRLGQEKVSQAADSDAVAGVREEEGEDLKESYEVGRESEGAEDAECVNRWPEEVDPGIFRVEVLEFWEACKGLHVELMRAIAMGLGTEPGWFDGYTDRGDNTLRLLHYPPVRKEVFRRQKGQVRAGAHSDYGSLTLLFQDQRGGLQVRGPEGGWIDAKPIEGTVVVNAGDLLMRWSNDMVKSTLHRVVEPPLAAGGVEGDGGESETYPARYSIAYFGNANFDRMIEVVPGTLKEGEPKKYEGVNSGEYLIRRLEATY